MRSAGSGSGAADSGESGALFEVEPPQAAGSNSGGERPLAVRMRPTTVDEVLGQGHLLGPGAPLRRLAEGGQAASVLLYGPPGTGKTTLANLMSQATGRRFVALSALSSGVKELRGVIEEAARLLSNGGRHTMLFIDEVHRFSRTQQDALLAAVENRTVLLMAATTENPFFSIVGPLLSRSLVLQLQPLGSADVDELVQRALLEPRGLDGRVALSERGREHLLRISGGDARKALTALEAAADAAEAGGEREISEELLESTVDQAALRYDRNGDQHYDVISAFIKSIRGSDPDAAVHYLARMIEAGEDPRFIARRLMVHASEDVGLADPSALPAAVAAAQTVQLVGLPEARLALAQVTIHLASAPKSNAVITAIDAAAADVRRGAVGEVPQHLRDAHYSGARHLGTGAGGHGGDYVYPHDVADGVLAQQYPPDELVGTDYYRPSARGAERAMAERLPRLRGIVRGGQADRAGQSRNGPEANESGTEPDHL